MMPKSPRQRLHLGCFDRPVPGWVNTDITPHIAVSRVPGAAQLLHRLGRLDSTRLAQHRDGVFRQVRRLDVGKRFPFESDSFEAVFSSHLLEHLPPDIARNCLSESHRVLCSGGVVRVGVPDLDLLVARYSPTEADDFVYRVFESRQSRDKNRHHWMYNEHSLAAALTEAGFADPVRRSYRVGACPNLDMLDNRPDETLFMEAVKP